VTFYGIDPRGISAGLEESMGAGIRMQEEAGMSGTFDSVRRAQNSLRTMSGETGGFAVLSQANIAAELDRVVADNSAYYVLGYSSSNERRDGRFRSVDVRVKRPGLRVRARKGYTAPRGRPASTVPPIATDASPAVRDALNSALPTSGLPLSVTAAPFAAARSMASIAVAVEIPAGQLKFTEQGGTFSEGIEVVAIAIDANGKMQDGGRDEAPMRLSQRSYDAVQQGGVRLTRRLTVPPGRYQVRVAARESNGGAVGAVTLDVDVPDFTKAPLALSGIAIASVAASRTVTANPDPGFKGVLPGPPTAMREFPRGDLLSVYAEVHDNQRGAHRVAIATTVLGDRGQPVFSASDERASEELAGRGGGFGHLVSVPLQDVPPGRYVLRIEARTLTSGGAATFREVEFRVR
jgi:hypothetical protein